MAKREPTDIAAEEYFEIQRSEAGRSAITDLLLLSLLAAVVLSSAFALFFAPQESFSETENRYLQRLEDIDISVSLKSGSFAKEISAMCSDQFPFREELISVKAALELCMQKKENNGVIAGFDGRLVARYEYSAEQKKTLSENLDSIEKFADSFEEKGVDTVIAVAPRAVDVAKSSLPQIYSTERADSAWEELRGIDRVDLLGELTSHSDENVWYRTDHHWTTLGAYYAYRALSERLGYQAIPLEDFNTETVSEDFYGTTWSKSGMYWTAADKLELFRFDQDEKFFIYSPEGEYISELYDLKKLEAKDKYSVFLGGDHGHIKISDKTVKSRLLIIKDSYFNSVAPFLCRHFELDVIDLRYFSGSVAEYARSEGFDKILVLCGIDSLATAPTFSQLEYKLSEP